MMNKKNNVYPCKPQFYYIKVGFKGVKIISACLRDELHVITMHLQISLVSYHSDNTDQASEGGKTTHTADILTD